MTYPDGEVVHYDYNLGGMLEKVYGQYRRNNFEPYGPSIPHDSIIPLNPNALNGQASLNGFPGSHDPVPMYTTYTYPYIDSIAYNEFELKSEVFYDNGTHTQYDYDSIQRLRMLQSRTSAGIDMQDISYTYDAVSNITGIVNAANYPGMNLGGTYSHSYEYDDLYRLTYSTGTWEDRPYHLGLVDTVRMAYHKNGRIARKNVFALTMSPTQMGVTNYNRRYDYSGQRNTLSNVYDSVANTSQNFSWDNSGNMVAHNGRSLTWTEDNRLQTVTDNEWFSYYQYDVGGDRTYKLPYNRTISNRSGRISYYWAAGDATLYASPYLVVTPRGYTKHYYAESERITSQIGRGKFSTLVTPVTDTATVNNKVRRADSLVLALNPGITDTAAQLSYLTALTNRQKDTCEAYWYHSDHLGSSSWITDSAGNPVQHLHYLPWGEDYVNQRLNDFDGVRYTFSAKEKDSETGLSYFGSRYYSSDLSIWLSVDPMSDKYPSLSPYVYCADNSVKLVDPNGEEIWIVGEDGNQYKYNNGNGAPNMSERFASYFGRINYAYKDRYLLTATIRRDGSSKFGADNHWGTFPSASLAWRASEESFIKNLDIFSNLKVRLGWGRVGNANVNATDALPQLSSSGSYDFYNIDGERYKRYFGLAQTSEIDTGLMWEASEQTNFGLDLGFLNGDLNITLDYYIRDTRNLILNKAIRPSAGFSSIKTNFGKIRNQGLEFNISYNKQLNHDWSIGIALNGEASKNKAVDIGTGTTTSGPTGAGWENKQVCYNGLPLGTFQGYVVDHIIKDQGEIDGLNAKAVEIYGDGSYYDRLTTGPGDFLFKDLNGDGHITTDDKAYLGDGFPDLTYGLNLTARYRNWDASAYIYGVIGQEILSWAKNYMTSIRSENEGYYNLLADYAKNSWSTLNPNASYPRLTRDDMSSNYRVSDYYVEKADYLKISNLQIGYTFNTKKVANYINNARIYASIQNLLTISPYNKYGDPEVNGGVTTMGYDAGRYPFPRTFMLGIQLGF